MKIMPGKTPVNSYGIRDNHQHGKVADFLVEKIKVDVRSVRFDMGRQQPVEALVSKREKKV